MFWSVLGPRSLKPPLVAAGAAALWLTATRTATSSALVSALSASPSGEARRSGSSSRRREPPGFAFGLIADVQWADADDGSNFSGTVKRHYRGAFANLVAAVDWWRAINGGTSDHDDRRPTLAFVAQLGDLVDGINAPLGQSHEALARALEQLDRLGPGCPAVNVVGNHELYNFDRKYLAEAPWLRHGDREFYRFSPAAGWSVVVLDAYQVSLIGHAEDDPRRAEAVALLARENPNIRPDGAAGGGWFDGIPRNSYRRRFVPYNGGYGREQLAWFAAELDRARGDGERVIVLSHVIVHPEACGGGTMAWDYDEALDIIHAANREKGSDGGTGDGGGGNTVVAVLCGHDHKGNYHRDAAGVHHCTFCSPLNQGAAGQAYGLVRVTPGGMEVSGPAVDDLLPAAAGRPPKRVIASDGAAPAAGRLESMFLPFRGGTREPPAIAAEDKGECALAQS